MIPEFNIEINNSYYFDMNGQIKQTPNDPSSPVPQSIKIYLKDGKIANLFLAYNPWKATNKNNRVYQFCIFCKNKRFDDETFIENRIFNLIKWRNGEFLSCCQRKNCVANLFDFMDQVDGNKLRTIIQVHSELSSTMLFEDMQQNHRYLQTKKANLMSD